MAGTNSSKNFAERTGTAPVIVLVRPQLAENMGTAARAMANCGLTALRLVRPRDSVLAEKAVAAASGAVPVLEQATVYETLEEALADRTLAVATTARRRGMAHEVVPPRVLAPRLVEIGLAGGRPALVFGPERTGLENDEVALCDLVCEVPLNPAFASLNLAQAVLLLGYEWRMAAMAAGDLAPPEAADLPEPADRDSLFNLFAHLERELDAVGFLRNQEKRPSMVRNIRTMLQRAKLNEQEIRTLHGIITGLRDGPHASKGPGKP